MYSLNILTSLLDLKTSNGNEKHW